MKRCLLMLLAIVGLGACKKENETLTKRETYKELVYRIQTQDSNLYVTFMRAVYTETVKGNIESDTFLVAPGFYSIPATVLTGAPVVLFGQSTKGPNFSLEIVDNAGSRLAATDTVTFFPRLDSVDLWVSRLSIIP